MSKTNDDWVSSMDVSCDFDYSIYFQEIPSNGKKKLVASIIISGYY